MDTWLVALGNKANYIYRGGLIMDKKNLLSTDDLADVFATLDKIPDEERPLTDEELASMRRYEQIIKKHKQQA